MANRTAHPNGGEKPERAKSAALIGRLRMGDERALAALITAFFRRLVGFVYTMLGSEDAAKDVVQQVFIRVWEVRATLDPERPIKPYLFALAKNQAISELRSREVRERHETAVRDDAAYNPELAYAPSAEDAILNDETMQAALRQLPERRQLAVRLRVENQLSHAEIAEVLELSPQAAERLVQRGLEDLRGMLRSFRV